MNKLILKGFEKKLNIQLNRRKFMQKKLIDSGNWVGEANLFRYHNAFITLFQKGGLNRKLQKVIERTFFYLKKYVHERKSISWFLPASTKLSEESRDGFSKKPREETLDMNLDLEDHVPARFEFVQKQIRQNYVPDSHIESEKYLENKLLMYRSFLYNRRLKKLEMLDQADSKSNFRLFNGNDTNINSYSFVSSLKIKDHSLFVNHLNMVTSFHKNKKDGVFTNATQKVNLRSSFFLNFVSRKLKVKESSELETVAFTNISEQKIRLFQHSFFYYMYPLEHIGHQLGNQPSLFASILAKYKELSLDLGSYFVKKADKLIKSNEQQVYNRSEYKYVPTLTIYQCYPKILLELLYYYGNYLDEWAIYKAKNPRKFQNKFNRFNKKTIKKINKNGMLKSSQVSSNMRSIKKPSQITTSPTKFMENLKSLLRLAIYLVPSQGMLPNELYAKKGMKFLLKTVNPREVNLSHIFNITEAEGLTYLSYDLPKRLRENHKELLSLIDNGRHSQICPYLTLETTGITYKLLQLPSSDMMLVKTYEDIQVTEILMELFKHIFTMEKLITTKTERTLKGRKEKILSFYSKDLNRLPEKRQLFFNSLVRSWFKLAIEKNPDYVRKYSVGKKEQQEKKCNSKIKRGFLKKPSTLYIFLEKLFIEIIMILEGDHLASDQLCNLNRDLNFSSKKWSLLGQYILSGSGKQKTQTPSKFYMHVNEHLSKLETAKNILDDSDDERKVNEAFLPKSTSQMYTHSKNHKKRKNPLEEQFDFLQEPSEPKCIDHFRWVSWSV